MCEQSSKVNICNGSAMKSASLSLGLALSSLLKPRSVYKNNSIRKMFKKKKLIFSLKVAKDITHSRGFSPDQMRENEISQKNFWGHPVCGTGGAEKKRLKCLTVAHAENSRG